MYPFFERDGAFFVAGAGTGAFVVMSMVTFQLLDPIGARLYSGLEGETSTANELHKLHRAGWRAVHNIHFKDRADVDHVAVGPGGVVVIETKTANADWPYLQRHGATVRWAEQAKRNVVPIRGLIKQHAKIVVDPSPIVVAWVRGQPDGPSSLPNGVTLVKGAELCDYLMDLPTHLEASDIQSIAAGLEAACKNFDSAAGVKHPGVLRRMLGVEVVG